MEPFAMPSYESASQSVESLQKQLEEADRQIAMLFKIIDEDNNNIRYASIIEKIYDEPEENHRSIIRSSLQESSRRDREYHQFVKQTADRLKEDNDTKVNQLTDLIYMIRSQFTYDLDDRDMLEFVQTKKGKCWHISLFFKDVCTQLGIVCSTVKGYADNGLHVWNTVTLAGCKMYFDITWYMTSGDLRFLWAAKEDFHASRQLV